MEGNLPVPGWNAHRHPQEALRPPNYVMKDVPKCAKDLKGSVLYEIRDRDQFKEAMAEMVLLCTEAMKRTSAKRCSAKPLSLEYIADRLDVDDPCFGYLVRSQEGMLQGFITLTTFTNWQKSFRWDSLHELAFYYDDSDSEDEEDDHNQDPGVDGKKRVKRKRRVDWDGEIARSLQETVRFGDPYNEGIVWPRIAELSLLGALGCGRTLVKLAIEQLEFQKASGTANYDYIALQATDNSIPFYESLGFTRVGAVTFQPSDNQQQDQSATRPDSPATVDSRDSAHVAEPLPPSSPAKADGLALPSDIVSSPLTVFEVQRPGETPNEIAKRNGINVWDIIFLNKEVYKGIVPSSRLMKGTILHLPVVQTSEQQPKNLAPTKWFVAKENDTPRKIAKMFSLPCKKLVEANQNRLPELMATSRLKEGTRIKVSNLHQHDDISNPYCHWSFPDDSAVDGGEPSYMMVYKLDRKTARNPRVVRSSLAVPIKPYAPPPLLLPRPEPQKKVIPHPDAPKPPLEPKLAIDIFKDHCRSIYPELADNTPDNERILDQRWDRLSNAKKDRYNAVALESRKHYDRAYEQYEVEYSLWEEENADRQPTTVIQKEPSLFNKVVKLRDDALEGHDYSYWFVLTYIPDLKWCHLAPMIQDGVFGPERKRSSGRPRWRLVDEKLGQEMDISSAFCIPVRSKTVKKTADADKEEWDIMDSPGPKVGGLKSPEATSDALQGSPRPIRKQPLRVRSAIKPMSGKLAIVKPTKTMPIQRFQEEDVIPSTLVSSTTDASSPRRRPHRMTPTKRQRSTPPRVSPRWSPKQQAKDDMEPVRKARRILASGTRRCALQS